MLQSFFKFLKDIALKTLGFFVQFKLLYLYLFKVQHTFHKKTEVTAGK